jgi:two-component system, NarL family, sensor histidine kinase BarA
MNAEQQKTIFDAFGQADKSVTRLYGGTGLGLVISQRLSREMGGDVAFISEENRGSTFWFTFKCELNQMPVNIPDFNTELIGKSVLYFEPHTHGRIATSEIMANWQMQVMPVDSLAELSTALEQGATYDYALISHDVTPSELTSLKELITYITPRIPNLHLAINSNSPNLQEALVAAGVKSCLSKPITPERLSRAFMPQQHSLSDSSPLFIRHKLPLKVLAVDDNEANLKLIKALLVEQVNEVTTASNGQEAVDLCKNEKFALIFMDIQMPIMDGVTALKNIQSSTFNDNTPIIAVTAHALSGEKEKLIEQGFNSYMTKPIDESMLRHTIYEYCDIELLGKNIEEPLLGLNESHFDFSTEEIDWQLALSRAGNKEDLAKDLLSGLVNSLPETKLHINDAILSQDVDQTKVLIHKLNGACCYTGVPLLGKITHQIETDLKQGKTLDDLEPEFFEFFEHIDNIVEQSPDVLKEIGDVSKVTS